MPPSCVSGSAPTTWRGACSTPSATMDLAAFYVVYRADGHGAAALDPAMMVALLVVRLRDRGALARGGIERRVRSRTSPFRVMRARTRSPITRRSRGFRGPPRARAGRAVRPGAGLCARGRAVSQGERDCRSTAPRCTPTRRGTAERAITSRSAAEVLARGRRASTRAEDERVRRARAATSCRPELATSQGRRGWLREAKRRWRSSATAEARPIPAARPERLKEAKRRLDEELRTECQANAAYEAYRAPRADEGRPTVRAPARPAQPCPARRRARST